MSRRTKRYGAQRQDSGGGIEHLVTPTDWWERHETPVPTPPPTRPKEVVTQRLSASRSRATEFLGRYVLQADVLEVLTLIQLRFAKEISSFRPVPHLPGIIYMNNTQLWQNKRIPPANRNAKPAQSLKFARAVLARECSTASTGITVYGELAMFSKKDDKTRLVVGFEMVDDPCNDAPCAVVTQEKSLVQTGYARELDLALDQSAAVGCQSVRLGEMAVDGPIGPDLRELLGTRLAVPLSPVRVQPRRNA